MTMNSSTELYPGKISPSLLTGLLETLGDLPESTVVGPGVGRDAAVLRLPSGPGPEDDWFLVAASDPITFTANEIGWYAVHVNANDVACMGASPAWFLATVLLPEGTEESEAKAIFRQIDEACGEVGAGLVGGHTEVTPGLPRPIVAGTMLGVTRRWVSGAKARPGDALLLTKGAAVEGTAILAAEAGERIRGRIPGEEGRDGADRLLKRARGFLRDPGLSVVPDARIALGAGTVHALHDPTERGVAGGIHELCDASGTGARIDLSAVPVFEETRLVAEALELDPLGLIASGALLVAVPEEDAAGVLRALEAEGIAAVRIGTLTDREGGVMARSGDGEATPLKRFSRDELTRVL